MKYYEFQDGTKVSALGMGNMRLPTKEDGSIDYQTGKAMIDGAMAGGINYYDTAYIYHGGASETFLGQAMADYPRNAYYLATKYNKSNPDYRAEFAEQLRRMRTDYVDFYMLHGVQDDSVDFYLGCGALEYFDSLKREGTIRHLGVSVHCSPHTLARILDAYAWDFVQLQLNYYDWLYGDARALHEVAVRHNIPIMVMEPVRGGNLATLTPEGDAMLKQSEPDKSIASWAFRWAASLPNVAVVLSGMSTLEQVQDNINTFAAYSPLTPQQESLLLEACKLYRATVSVACTACRYCCDDCPQGLEIPHLLSVYNDMKMGGEWRVSFLNHLPEEKKPAACIGCGVCSGLCPQGFDIPTYLQEMAALGARFQG